MARKRKKVETKSKFKFSKLIVLLVIILNIFFTLGVMYMFLKTSSEPSVLIGSWFGFTTVELWNLATIKNNENKEN